MTRDQEQYFIDAALDRSTREAAAELRRIFALHWKIGCTLTWAHWNDHETTAEIRDFLYRRFGAANRWMESALSHNESIACRSGSGIPATEGSVKWAESDLAAIRRVLEGMEWLKGMAPEHPHTKVEEFDPDFERKAADWDRYVRRGPAKLKKAA